MKKKTKKPAKTRVICAYTNCIHNKVDGMEYVCTLDKICISVNYTSDKSFPPIMECKMRERA
jgi:hypothetical protein